VRNIRVLWLVGTFLVALSRMKRRREFALLTGGACPCSGLVILSSIACFNVNC
jgi:hypothetical protein